MVIDTKLLITDTKLKNNFLILLNLKKRKALKALRFFILGGSREYKVVPSVWYSHGFPYLAESNN